ncbi:MAG: serine--tRNA ligase [Ignisphaera sp.]|nr:serine--tRNA ligase [Ignisphaera sp.]MCX8167887.1 serine--tRNA ligase [Ignisphaera sp.]MDW8085472.1 serine--tRNA ligase [Ignisphaera sp.]
MRFTGIIEIVFNKTISEDVKKEIEGLIEYLNRDYLKRGARDPREAAHINSYTFKDSGIVLEIETGSKVRIDEATLRVKNVLSTSLGSKYRIGVRGVNLHNPIITLDNKISISLKIPLIKSIASDGDHTIIELVELDESDLKKPLFLRLLRLIEDKEQRARWGGKSEHWVLIKRSGKKTVEASMGDPNDVLERIGWMKRMSVGQWLYTPPLTHMLNTLKRLFIDEVVKPLGFEEATFPKMYPLEVGLKTGHLKGVINSMIFASLPRSYDISEFEEFIDLMYVLNEAPPEELQRHLRPSSYFLCFAQCEPFYWFFENEILDDSSLPIKWYDQSGPSYRWESGGIHGIERLIEFHRIEVVWLGRPDDVIKIRNELLERYEYFMDKVLDIEWRMAWVTPWFYEQSGALQGLKESTIEIDKPGTIDFEAWLPYRGDRDDSKNWIEVGNISIHGTKFTEPFRIKHNRGETLWTGCSGFGSERWFIVLLAQKGLNIDNWPKKYIEYIKAIPFPRSIDTITYPRTKDGKELLAKIINLLKQ